MPQDQSDIRYLMDRAAIHDLLVRYFQGLDRCLPDQVRSCFAEDIQAAYDERPPIKGIEVLMSSFRTFKRMQDGKWPLVCSRRLAELRKRWRRLAGLPLFNGRLDDPDPPGSTLQVQADRLSRPFEDWRSG